MGGPAGGPLNNQPVKDTLKYCVAFEGASVIALGCGAAGFGAGGVLGGAPPTSLLPRMTHPNPPRPGPQARSVIVDMECGVINEMLKVCGGA